MKSHSECPPPRSSAAGRSAGGNRSPGSPPSPSRSREQREERRRQLIDIIDTALAIIDDDLPDDCPRGMVLDPLCQQ